MTWQKGGSADDQLHRGTFRLTARGATVGTFGAPYALLKASIEFGHYNPPTGYSDLVCMQSLPLIKPSGKSLI